MRALFSLTIGIFVLFSSFTLQAGTISLGSSSSHSMRDVREVRIYKWTDAGPVLFQTVNVTPGTDIAANAPTDAPYYLSITRRSGSGERIRFSKWVLPSDASTGLRAKWLKAVDAGTFEDSSRLVQGGWLDHAPKLAAPRFDERSAAAPAAGIGPGTGGDGVLPGANAGAGSQ